MTTAVLFDSATPGLIGPAGTPPPRQFHSIDDLATLLRADFAANGIDSVVEVDEWRPEWHAGAPRVVLAFGDFSFVQPQGTDQPGANIEIPDGTGDVARAILDDLCVFRVWCHHPGTGSSGEPTAAAARRATKALLQDTVRAIREGIAAPFREPPTGSWPKPSEQAPGYPAFTYGSFVTFKVMLPVPVLGGRLHVGTVSEIDFSDSIVIGGITSASGSTIGSQPS